MRTRAEAEKLCAVLRSMLKRHSTPHTVDIACVKVASIWEDLWARKSDITPVTLQ